MRTVEEVIRPGLPVKVGPLLSTAGMIISERALSRRETGVTGKVHGYVAGHGGDVWWVVHEGARRVGDNWDPRDDKYYDVIVNTDRLSPEAAAQIIVAGVKAKSESVAS